MRNSLAEARGAREVTQTSAASKRRSVTSEQGTGYTFMMSYRADKMNLDMQSQIITTEN